MYCITINNSHFEKIKRIGYLPVGLGDNNFSKDSNFPFLEVFAKLLAIQKISHF